MGMVAIMIITIGIVAAVILSIMCKGSKDQSCMQVLLGAINPIVAIASASHKSPSSADNAAIIRENQNQAFELNQMKLALEHQQALAREAREAKEAETKSGKTPRKRQSVTTLPG
jgi:hypothetical protein